jgi:hypothetical protein
LATLPAALRAKSNPTSASSPPSVPIAMQLPCRSRNLPSGLGTRERLKPPSQQLQSFKPKLRASLEVNHCKFRPGAWHARALTPPLLIANNKDPDENLLQQLPLRHSSATFLVSSPKYSSRIGPADRGTQPQHQSRRTMRKQHAINPKVLVGEMGFNRLSLQLNPILTRCRSRGPRRSTETKMLPTTQCST